MGTTLSYGNGRRLDDSKSLGELSFQVNLNIYTHMHNHVCINFIKLIFFFILDNVDWRLLGCGNLLEEKLLMHEVAMLLF